MRERELVGAAGPVATILMAISVPGEVITPLHFVGMEMVLISVLTICLKPKQGLSIEALTKQG